VANPQTGKPKPASIAPQSGPSSSSGGTGTAAEPVPLAGESERSIQRLESRQSRWQSSVAQTAESRLVLRISLPGNCVLTQPSIVHSGKPAGCATPGPAAASVNAPASTRHTFGAVER